MKIKIGQKNLIESLKIVSRAVSGQNQLPVLGNILIRAENKKVYFSATNLEISISTSTDAEIKNEGAITVPAKIFTSYISLLQKDEDINLEIDGNADLKIKSKSSKTKIKGIPADEFPSIARVENGAKINLDAKIFRDSVSKVAFSAQENSSRPILAGVFLAIEKKELRMAATDSYRLSEKILELENSLEKISSLIPVRAIFEADRLIGDAEKISITISENQAMFLIGNTELTTRLIEGQFPNYQQIIPQKKLTTVQIDRSELEMAVRRVSIFAKENNQHMKLEFLGEKTCQISTNATEIGEEQASISAKISGENSSISLNADYFLDALSALGKEEKIEIELSGKMSPAVLKIPKNKNFVHLIMPLKI